MSTTSRLVGALILCGLFLLGSGPLMADKYYVSTSGDDKNDGRSEAQAWRTVKFAAEKAAAGDTVYIKAGLYHEPAGVVIKKSGAEKAPIVFQGYKDKPDEPFDLKYKPGDMLNPDVLPVLEGENGAGTGIASRGKNYITIRNLGVTSYNGGIAPASGKYIELENVFAVRLGNDEGVGLWLCDCTDCTIRNCVVVDGARGDIHLQRTHNSLVENCKCYGVIFAPRLASTDYYLCIRDGHDNVVRGCLAHNLHAERYTEHRGGHPGHGIGIKDQQMARDESRFPHSHHNKFIDCVSLNMGEYFFVAHGAHDNEFINCTAIGQWRNQSHWSEGINIRDGVHGNVFRNCRVEGARTSATIQDTVEGPENPDRSPVTQICTKNTLVNCVFADSELGINIWNADDNTFENCVFDNVGQRALVRFLAGDAKRRIDHRNQGNVCRNCIVTNVRGAYQRDDKDAGDKVLFAYSNFWKNTFEMPSGDGNMAKDPLYVDAANRNFHLKSQAGHWDKKTSNWVKDGQTSPCIDAGNPADDYAKEPQPNGGRINIGAYGNTVGASKSPSR